MVGFAPTMVDEPAPKTLRNGRYAVVRGLGEGSQAATFEAVDKLEGRPVAIKRFRVRGAKSWKEVELAEREARVLASIAHPLLPRYVEHFEEAGELFLVTEKIEGENLLSLRKRGVRTSEADAVRFLRDASAALDYLHNLAPPVVHRDIKPSNVMRRPDGSFALIDFGSVRDRMKPEGGSTVVGTFGYMAPEQFQGRAMPASDVYAVGATALSMLTGREPEDLPHKGLAIDVKAALGSGVSPALVSALVAMLEPDPEKRAPRIAPLLSRIGSAPKPPEPARKASAPAPPPWAPPEQQGRGEQKRDKREERGSRKESKRDAKEARKEAEQAAREARKEAEQAAKEARKEAQRAAKDARRQAERAVRERYGRHSDRGFSQRVPGPILFLLLFGLSIGQIAVMLALRVAIPIVFTLLSIVFGKSWREAAKSVSQAGKVAIESMDRAKAVVSGRPDPADAPGVRVDVPEQGPRVRVDPGSAPDSDRDERDERAEREAEAEREADEKRRGRARRG